MTSTSSAQRTGDATSTAIIGCITTCMAVASVYLMQPVMTEIGSTFNVAPNDARLAFSSASIAYATAFFFLGPLSDRLDPRQLALAGLLVGALGLGLASVLHDFHLLLAVLAMQGAAAALVPAAMYALLPRIARKEHLGTYFGLLISATVVGITVGRFGMGLATATLGLRGALQFCAAILVLVAGLNQTLPPAIASMSAASPLRTTYANAVRMLRTPALLRLFGTGFLLFFGYLGVLTFLTLHLHQSPFSYDSATIGSISLLGLSALFGAPLSGRVTARFGSYPVGVGGFCVVLLAIACLALATTKMVISVGIVLLFLGVFSCQPAIFVKITQRVSSESRGAASSMYMLACLGAGSASSVLLGAVWVKGGWTALCSICAAAVMLAACLLTWDKRFEPREP